MELDRLHTQKTQQINRKAGPVMGIHKVEEKK